jgi:hypothetical protein
MRNSCGTKKIIPKANKIVVITGFSLSEASGAFRAAADPLSRGAAKPTQPSAFTETNSVRLCGRDVDGKWSDVATRR